MDLEKPELRKMWTQKNLVPEKPGPWKIWTLKNLDYKKRRKQLEAEKKIRRPHGKSNIYDGGFPRKYLTVKSH